MKLAFRIGFNIFVSYFAMVLYLELYCISYDDYFKLDNKHYT